MGCNKHASVASGNTMTSSVKKNESMKRNNSSRNGIAPVVIRDSGQEGQIGVKKKDAGVDNVEKKAAIKVKKTDNLDVGAEKEVDNIYEKKDLVEDKKIDYLDVQDEVVVAKKIDDSSVDITVTENVGVGLSGSPPSVAGVDGNEDVMTRNVVEKGDENVEGGDRTEEAAANVKAVVECNITELDRASDHSVEEADAAEAKVAEIEGLDSAGEVVGVARKEDGVSVVVVEEKCDVVEVTPGAASGGAEEAVAAKVEVGITGAATVVANEVDEEKVVAQVAGIGGAAEKADDLPAEQAVVAEAEDGVVEADIIENVGTSNTKEVNNEDNDNRKPAEEANVVKTCQEPAEEVANAIDVVAKETVVERNMVENRESNGSTVEADQNIKSREEIEKNDVAKCSGEEEQVTISEDNVAEIFEEAFVPEPKAAEEEAVEEGAYDLQIRDTKCSFSLEAKAKVHKC